MWTAVAANQAVVRVALFTRELPRAGELSGDFGAFAAKHFDWGWAGEGAVGHDGVVLFDEESHVLANGGLGVEGVEVEPTVFERAPEGFDHGVGVGDLDLGEHMLQAALLEQSFDVGVYVLGAAIGEQGGMYGGGAGQVLVGLRQHVAGQKRGELGGDVPGEDHAGEVVDDGADEHARAIEEANRGCVDVPQLVGLGRSHAKRGLGGIEPEPWPAPAAPSHESLPGGLREENATRTLRKLGERGDGHVSVGIAGHHVLDDRDFGSGGSCWRGLWAGRMVVECAAKRGALPGVVSRRGEPKHTERCGERHGPTSAIDGCEQYALVASRRDAVVVQPQAERADQRDEQNHDGLQYGELALQASDFGVELKLGVTRRIEAIDAALATCNPSAGRGIRDPQHGKQMRVSGGDDGATDPMVVSASNR